MEANWNNRIAMSEQRLRQLALEGVSAKASTMLVPDLRTDGDEGDVAVHDEPTTDAKHSDASKGCHSWRGKPRIPRQASLVISSVA